LSRTHCWAAQLGSILWLRAAARLDAETTVTTVAEPDTVAAAQGLLDMIDSLLITDGIAELASTVGPPQLRTPDAVHLATLLAHH
jgi:predicted nucleic acid-binding protein